MAEDTKPTGAAAGAAASANTEGADDAGGDGPASEPVIPQSQHNAGMARMRKELDAIKKALVERDTKLAEYAAKDEEKATAQLSAEERMQRELAKIREDHGKMIAAEKAKVEEERKLRHDLIKRNGLLEQITKIGFLEPDIVLDHLLNKVQVGQDGAVVAADDSYLPVDEVVGKFAKAHPRLVRDATPGGTGDRGGQPPRQGKKRPSDMSKQELEEAALAELESMRGQPGQPYMR